jgi:hypothetical protein
MNNDAQFTDRRLSTLREPDNFAPNAARARRRMAAPPRTSARAWITRAAIATVMVLILLSLPAMRAKAQESPQSGVGYVICQVILVASAHWQHIERWWNSN